MEGTGRDSIAPTHTTQPGGTIRKADMAYNHLELAPRVGPCKAARARVGINTNYFKLNCPGRIKYVTFRLDFEVENPRSKGNKEPVKADRMAELFKKVYVEHRSIFPRKDAALVYNGTDMIYCPPDHKITRDSVIFTAVTGARGRDGRPPGRDQKGRMIITPLGLSEISTVCVDNEQDRCALMQFLDCVLSQEHRFDLTGQAARFIQHGHALFKIPRSEMEKRHDVKPIGKGEEVWLGLHAAVKCDSEELMLNADTSGSIFKSRNLHLIQFFAQVLRGYTGNISEITETDRLTIDQRGVRDMEFALKGTKLLMRPPGGPEKVKKFDGFTEQVANMQRFQLNGQWITISEYYMQQHNYRLRYPNFPCLRFKNKTFGGYSAIPMEFFYTLDEPTRFKGKLSDQQLDVFVKAVCENPKEKKARIERFCVAGGEYLGDSNTMKEWGVSLEREMIQIDDCPILPLPHIEMAASAPQIAVDSETGQWKVTETDAQGRERPLKPIELNGSRFVLVVVYVNHQQKDTDNEHVNFIRNTLLSFGMQVYDDIGKFTVDILEEHGRGHYSTCNARIEKNIETVKAHCASIQEKKGGGPVIPLYVWVFPRRNALTYAAIKYYCDVVHGIPNQCILRKTFEKLIGNPITNSSGQNIMMKVHAKTGSVEFRLSPFNHKNVERVQNPEEPVLILGIDVSHPGREERFDAKIKHETAMGRTAAQANQHRGAHEKLPTARPVGKGIFEGINYYDTPRSVVSVVGTTDFKGSRFGVSSRVQRLGQEEAVNMVEPFRERIQEFFDKTGALPKHILVYRDGVSDSQVKKISYEELESLERAMETFEIEKDQCTITYITAVKRHHTRFFRANLDMMDSEMPHLNCPPGTLVEEKIVSRNKFDFYLQSHYGNLGTALPTRYTVVRDDWKVSQSFIQTVIFAHCFGNLRCPRPLSIPIPLYYAHLAAKRSKVLFDHFKTNPSDEYIRSEEDIVRESIEKLAVTPHDQIKTLKAMHYM